MRPIEKEDTRTMNKISEEYDAGMGTTIGMWELLSDVLAEYKEKLPDSLNEAIYALRDGKAKVMLKMNKGEY